jgi:predicted DNA binding CopG/RHH family protein
LRIKVISAYAETKDAKRWRENMSGTKKKTKPISKSTKSGSKKQGQPSKDTLDNEIDESTISRLKAVSRQKIALSQKAKSFKISADGREEITKEQLSRRAGRPSKPTDLKEKNHIVRFSDRFLTLLKKQATLAGFAAWQTYLKSVVAQEIGFKEGQ